MLDFWPPNTFLVFSQRNTLWHAIPVAHNTSTDDILKTLGQQLGPPCRNPADLWMSPSQPSWGVCVCVGGKTAVTAPALRASSFQAHSLPSLWFPQGFWSSELCVDYGRCDLQTASPVHLAPALA